MFIKRFVLSLMYQIERIMTTQNNITRTEFINVIVKSEQSFNNNFSHIYGSDYYTVGGYNIRISDHSKHKNSLGYETYSGGNDFRGYGEALNYLSERLDMTNKTELKSGFYVKNAKFIKQIDETTFSTPYGSFFADIESALNNWWRTRRDFIVGNLN